MRRRWRKVGPAEAEAHLLHREAAHFGCDLRHRRIGARSHIARRDLDLGGPVGQQAHARAETPPNARVAEPCENPRYMKEPLRERMIGAFFRPAMPIKRACCGGKNPYSPQEQAHSAPD